MTQEQKDWLLEAIAAQVTWAMENSRAGVAEDIAAHGAVMSNIRNYLDQVT